MSRLLVYTDLSPSWPWLFATVQANTDMLAKYGIVCAAFGPYTTERIPSHNFYWSGIVKEGVEVSEPIRNRMNSLLELLDAGKDVLLMDYVASLKAHQSFTRLLQSDIRFAAHQIHLLFRLGNPACVFEQRFRLRLSAMPTADCFALIRRFSALASLVTLTLQQWGKERVMLLADVAGSPVPTRTDDMTSQLFAWLGCPPPTLLEHTPLHHLFLASWEARRLSWTPEVGFNAWPPLNMGSFMDCLAQVEQGWGRGPVSPLKYRRILLREGNDNTSTLEKLLGLTPGSLACPEWLAEQHEISFGQPLPKDKVAAFAHALPEPEHAILRQRYSNDTLLLTPDQQALAAALHTVDGTVSHIGEPIPSPTLTVLTMTYNHEKYIADCMDSVLAQKTNFPVRHIVLDHRSQDDTPKIVAAYAAKHPSIQPVLLSRRVHNLNVRGLFARCRSTYASICDGDDYFTDPLKLQKQVDYLEKNQDCALCAHPVQVVFEYGEHQNYVYPPASMLSLGSSAKYSIKHLLQGNFIQTNAVIYRWRFTGGLPPWFRADLCPGDWYWHLLHAEMGKIGFMPKVMSIYRRHKNAIYHTAHTSVINHRKIHGMQELAMYKAVNEHFNGKYFADLATLANGVLVDFLKISMDKNDDSLLNIATKKFPEFSKYFLESMKKLY